MEESIQEKFNKWYENAERNTLGNIQLTTNDEFCKEISDTHINWAIKNISQEEDDVNGNWFVKYKNKQFLMRSIYKMALIYSIFGRWNEKYNNIVIRVSGDIYNFFQAEQVWEDIKNDSKVIYINKEYSIDDFLKINTETLKLGEDNGIGYYWVCQGQAYSEHKKLGILYAGNKTEYRRLKELKPGDKIINYLNRQVGIIATSTVKSYPEINDNDITVKVEYNELKQPISREYYRNILLNSGENLFNNAFPFEKNDKLDCKNRGYIFNFSKKLYNLIFKIESNTRTINDKGDKMPTNIQFNQILYGPPGTGKTYNTVVKAMEILEPNLFEDKNNKPAYELLKKKFDEYRNKHQIEFVTFHQSYSYEEFVEGIKPQIKEWNATTEDNIKYIGQDGIFKRICDRAKKKILINKASIIEFREIIEEFKIRYPEGEEFETLKDLQYRDYETISYKYGNQPGERKIDINKIKKYMSENKHFDSAVDFYNTYGGSIGLKSYIYKFYCELENIKQSLLENKFRNDLINIPHVLIVDEINRGNISKIFGELITLIEEDKREKVIEDDKEYNTLSVTLPYSQQQFTVPNNLYIIGTMNTSDRSIASVDIALRRRFKFVEMMPKPDLLEDVKIGEIELKELLEKLNQRISILLDRDHQIGHSYFMQFKDEKQPISIKELKQVWFDSIMPLLNEYFYGDWDKLQDLLGVADDSNYSFVQEYKTENILCSNKSCVENAYFDFRPINEYKENAQFETAIKYLLKGTAN